MLCSSTIVVTVLQQIQKHHHFDVLHFRNWLCFWQWMQTEQLWHFMFHFHLCLNFQMIKMNELQLVARTILLYCALRLKSAFHSYIFFQFYFAVPFAFALMSFDNDKAIVFNSEYWIKQIPFNNGICNYHWFCISPNTSNGEREWTNDDAHLKSGFQWRRTIDPLLRCNFILKRDEKGRERKKRMAKTVLNAFQTCMSFESIDLCANWIHAIATYIHSPVMKRISIESAHNGFVFYCPFASHRWIQCVAVTIVSYSGALMW